jgi:hypothetical protein
LKFVTEIQMNFKSLNSITANMNSSFNEAYGICVKLKFFIATK